MTDTSAASQAAPRPKKKALEDFAQPVNGNPPPMSEALARKYTVNNTIIVTWANYALWDFVRSWATHAKSLGECTRQEPG